MLIEIEKRDIESGEPGSAFRNPLALACGRALTALYGASEPVLACVHTGPAHSLIAENRMMPESMDAALRLYLRFDGREYVLPYRAEIFLRAYAYGPGCSPLRVVTPRGFRLCTYAQVVRPFRFALDVNNLDVNALDVNEERKS
jgi:hypothetical protein